jgi:hypothetical protein
LGSAESSLSVGKIIKWFSKIDEIWTLTLGSTHDNKRKYEFSVSGSIGSTRSGKKKSSGGKYKCMRVGTTFIDTWKYKC